MTRPYRSSRELVLLGYLRVREGELYYEVCQRWGFYGRFGSILYIELTKLNGPLYRSSCSLGFIHRFLNGLIRHYYDRVRLKVRMKLSRGHY